MIDLHIHTTYSDGSYNVLELLKEAQKNKLRLISITDHNTIQPYFELLNFNIRNIFAGEIITGIEITTTYKGETIEVLGYGFNIDKMQHYLNENVLTFEEKQLKEYELIKKKYKKVGVIFDEKNIQFNPKTESCRNAFLQEIKKHSQNNKFFLYGKSITTNTSFTRNEVYNPKSPLYVNESCLFPSLEKTIEIIHKAGGLAFLAHIFAYSPNIANDLLNIINNYELDGLECFYTTYNAEQTNYLIQICKEKKLYMSGGSDFHGLRKINHNLGTGQGNLYIPENEVSAWVTKYISNFNQNKYFNKK